MQGRVFEEFEPGQLVETAGRTITEADIVMFAGLTGDYSELHTNAEFATSTRFGQRIAHGALVFSLSIGLATRTGVLEGTLIAFSRVDNLRFPKPVFIGDTLHVAKTVIGVEDKGPAQGVVTFDTRVRNQRGEVVLAFIDRLLVARRDAVAPAMRQANPAMECGAPNARVL
jgi:3-hydroxybutyryl-CoA dehydratase